MPLTLEKLFASSVTTPIPFLDDDVKVRWAPLRWTGEMQERADAMVSEGEEETAKLAALRVDAVAAAMRVAELSQQDEPDPTELAEARKRDRDLEAEIGRRERALDAGGKGFIRKALATLLVGWDLMDGSVPFPTDEASLARLPDAFLRVVYFGLSSENRADPTKGESSSEPSNTPSSTETTTSPTGSRSSRRAARSASRRSTSTNGRTPPATIRSGGPGR